MKASGTPLIFSLLFMLVYKDKNIFYSEMLYDTCLHVIYMHVAFTPTLLPLYLECYADSQTIGANYPVLP